MTVSYKCSTRALSGSRSYLTWGPLSSSSSPRPQAANLSRPDAPPPFPLTPQSAQPTPSPRVPSVPLPHSCSALTLHPKSRRTILNFYIGSLVRSHHRAKSCWHPELEKNTGLVRPTLSLAICRWMHTAQGARSLPASRPYIITYLMSNNSYLITGFDREKPPNAEVRFYEQVST